jgi:DNA gyrase subunit A
MANTHDNILFFTNRGRVYRQKGYEIPEFKRQAKGTAIVNLLPITSGEKITAVIAVADKMDADQDKYMFMATNNGTVKKTAVKDFNSARRAGLIAINLDDNEQLIDVKLTDGKSQVLLATNNGYAIRFGEDDVRPMGRTAHGVRGIALRKDDTVVSMDCCNDEAVEVLTASELGMGKRTSLSDYRKQTRGGKGIINLKITSKTGAIIGSKIINNDQEVIFITTAGVINRQEAKKISTYKRNTQGVKLVNLDTGDKLAALAVVSPMDTDEEEETEE